MLSTGDALTLLEEHPRRIAAATKGIPAERLRREPVLGVWTAIDILAHLRSCEDARGEVIPVIAKGDHPTLKAIDPRTLAERTDYRELDFATSLRAWTRQRMRLARFLKTLPARAWSRSATFTGFGTPRDRDVRFYVERLLRHEAAHVRHLERHFIEGRPASTRRR